jgi:hypothetical protein
VSTRFPYHVEDGGHRSSVHSFPYHVEDGGGVVIIFQMDGDERGLDVDLKGELS